jgi:hypothetical protein
VASPLANVQVAVEGVDLTLADGDAVTTAPDRASSTTTLPWRAGASKHL